ncbi:MAG: glycosyl hydrolase 53 family protein [Pseudomonadota bacterium]
MINRQQFTYLPKRALLALAATLLLAACGSAGTGSQAAPAVAPAQPHIEGFAKGADVGWLTEMEDSGRKFYNKAGVEKDLLVILKEQGMDSIRLRVWVNPEKKYNGMADVLAKAKRVKAAGMRLMIDFHYSDNWADPGKQTKPALWKDYGIDQLVKAVADHTRDSLTMLRDAGISPEWVQVGNETSNGMLWDEGKAKENMKNYARLVASGYDASKEVFPKALVILHLAECHNNGLFRWNVGGVKANGGKFDIIGASAYPFWDKDSPNWQISNSSCLTNLNDMANTYKVPVMLVEVGTAWNDPEAKAIIADLIAKTRSVAGKKGVGVFYWEPAAYNNWSGYNMGAFDNAGKPAAAMDAFLE